jgi:hypothetical protein
MILEILNKLLVVSFILSLLTILRHGYYFIQAFITSTEENQKTYRIDKLKLLILGISISYVITSLFTGIKI